MSYEHTNWESPAEPHGWVPAHPGVWKDYQDDREKFQWRWTMQAENYNRLRPFTAKLLGRYRLEADVFMRDEAEIDNFLIDAGQTIPELETQRRSGELLETHGFAPHHRFGSEEELKEALGYEYQDPLTCDDLILSDQEAFSRSVLQDLDSLPSTEEPAKRQDGES